MRLGSEMEAPTQGTRSTTAAPRKLLLLGAGELGRELARSAQRLGLHVTAADRYDDAPAMHVADARRIVDLSSPAHVRKLVEQERPDYIVPELEDLAAFELERLEAEGWHVVPSAKAARLTMDREGIRRLAAEQLELRTSRYFFASSLPSYRAAATALGVPHLVKPTRSTKGQGHTLVREHAQIAEAWLTGVTAPRTRTGRVIVEEYVPFDHEFTLLAVRHANGIEFCAPIGHRQGAGGFLESWQPHPVADALLQEAQATARTLVETLGGHGVFGLEFLVKGDRLYFSEISTGPHDTGFVTLTTQQLNQFDLHARAMSGASITADDVALQTPGAAAAILAHVETDHPVMDGIGNAEQVPGVRIETFDKPHAWPNRRMGIALAQASDTQTARFNARQAAQRVHARPPEPPTRAPTPPTHAP